MRAAGRSCCGRCFRGISLPGLTARRCRGVGSCRLSGGPTSSVRERATTGAFDRLDSRQVLRLGELVRVTTGAFEDMVGRLVELRDQDRIVVLLELLGRAVRAQLRGEVVEPA